MGLNRLKTALRSSKWCFAHLSGLLCLGVLTSSLDALAGNSVPTANVITYPGPAQTPAWTDSTRYVECGQDCLYQKANENVTLQALYLMKKMENLERVLEGKQDSDYAKVVSELKLYCPDVTANPPKAEDANLCYRRYIQTQLPILRGMKATLVKNEDMTARLRTDQSAFGGGSAAARHFQDETQGTRLAQTPEFYRESELLTSQAAGERLRYLASEGYQKWSDDVSKAAPRPEDFPKTALVLKDPTDPTSIKVNRILRNNDGSPVLDKTAYDQAKKEFDNHFIGDTASKTPAELDIRNVAAKKNYSKSRVQDIDPDLYINARQPVPKGQLPYVSEVDNLSYQQARNLAVSSEASLFARGVSTKTYPGANRKTASADPKKSGAPPTAPAATENKSSRADNDPNANDPGYYAVITENLQKIKEAPAPTLPAAGSNRVYNVTLSPEQIDETIGRFQKGLDQLTVN